MHICRLLDGRVPSELLEVKLSCLKADFSAADFAQPRFPAFQGTAKARDSLGRRRRGAPCRRDQSQSSFATARANSQGIGRLAHGLGGGHGAIGTIRTKLASGRNRPDRFEHNTNVLASAHYALGSVRICVRVCVRVRAWVRVCERVQVWVWARVWGCGCGWRSVQAGQVRVRAWSGAFGERP